MTANSSKELPFVVRQQDFEKMSLTLADGEFRDKKILIYMLCFSTTGLFINFYCVYYSELTFSIYIYMNYLDVRYLIYQLL